MTTTVSRRLGLINGYFFGLVKDRTTPELAVSDPLQGAAEDVERSLRHYRCHGIMRLCWATCVAKTWCNEGGLQSSFCGNPAARRLYHDCALTALQREFPELVLDETRPNRCRFVSTALPEGAPEQEAVPETAVGCPPEAANPQEDARADLACAVPPEHKPRKPTQPPSEPLRCQMCDKEYRRKADLQHHCATQHGGDVQRHVCPKCGKALLKRKDMQAHLVGGRCWSTRGRYTQKGLG